MTLQEVLERAKLEGASHYKVQTHPTDGRAFISVVKPQKHGHRITYIIAESWAIPDTEDEFANLGQWGPGTVPEGVVDNSYYPNPWQRIPDHLV